MELDTKRTFNHDLLVDPADQHLAKSRWPGLADVLIDPALVKVFKPHETDAKRCKVRLQWMGTSAVLLCLASLCAGAVPFSILSLHIEPERFDQFSEGAALLGLVAAALASRFGPIRRRWLHHRFVTEVLRQWHFRRLLLTIFTGSNPKDTSVKKAKTLDEVMHELRGVVGQKMDRLIEQGDDPLETFLLPTFSGNMAQCAELVDAYRQLRLDHQIDYIVYKLSAEDQTFLGLSNRILVEVTDRLAGFTLVGALLFSLTRLFAPMEIAGFVGILLATCGVAVRAWRDGMALSDERERYQEMRHHLEILRTRWEAAPNDVGRFHIAQEVEQAAVEELRSFLRSNERAQFLF
jgi:hypothetical protein